MNSVDYSTMMTNDTLAHLVIINQMAATTGCTHDQAKQLLTSTEWRLEPAVNLFFDERTIPIPCCKFSELITPANTPVTPPNFPETLLSFHKLSTSAGTAGSNDNSICSVPTTTITTTTTSPAAVNPSLSSSPMNMTMMMMMDGTA